MKKTKKSSKNFLKNERGQGATEYILLLVVVVGLVMIFKDKIQTTVKDKISSLSSDITGVTAQ